MKEKITAIKEQHPEYGYKRIASIVGCSPNSVKYHLHPTLKATYHSRQTLNREIQLHKLKTLFGGRCQVCGYKKCFDALCFHHLDANQKTDTVPNILRAFGIARASEEAKKCKLLCHNCHSEFHAGLITL